MEDAKIEKNLMNVLEHLEAKSLRLEDVVSLSKVILDKFDNPKKGSIPQGKKEETTLEQEPMGLLDLFYNALDKIEYETNRLHDCLQQINITVG